MNDVEVANALLDVAGLVGDGGLAGEHLSHVVGLHVAEGLLVVLAAPTEEVVQVLNQVVGFGVGLHQVNEGHSPSLKPGFEVVVKDLSEGDHGLARVDVSEVIFVAFVLELECFFVSHQELSERKNVDHHRN